MRGRIPKPNSGRIASHSSRRNRVLKIPGQVKAPRGKTEWGKEAKALYRSIRQSGQCAFYEPSDWQLCLVLCDALDAWYSRPVYVRKTGDFDQIIKLAERLNLTYLSRLRGHIEVERIPESQSQSGDSDPGKAERIAALRERARRKEMLEELYPNASQPPAVNPPAPVSRQPG